MSRQETRFRWCSAAGLTNPIDTLYHCIPASLRSSPGSTRDSHTQLASNFYAAGKPMKKLSSKWHDARRVLSLSKYLVAGAAMLAIGHAAFAQDAKIQVVAAENFYGDVVHQLGGEHVDVTSILSNPDEDPHL